MKYKATIVTLCLCCLFAPVLIRAQSSDQLSNGKERTKRKTKVDVKYDKKKDLSTVWLEEIVLWKNPTRFEQVTMIVSFDFPKRTIIIPEHVTLIFSSATDKSDAFPNEKLEVELDNVKLKLGPLERRSTRSLTPTPGFRFDTVRTTIPYQLYFRIASAKHITLSVAGRGYVLTADDIQLLSDFLQLMRQDGQDFR